MSNWQKQAADEQLEKCRRELWEALGYGTPHGMPSSSWESAIEAVKKQTETLGNIRGLVR